MRMDAEKAHDLAMTGLRLGLSPSYTVHDQSLETTVCGMVFKNPLGLAAGFDKNGAAISPVFKMGFGAVEVGTVTRYAQSGNDKPRVFRDISSQSVINRMGFPGLGLESARKKLISQKLTQQKYAGVLGINIGINKNTQTPLDDYKYCLDQLSPYADYVTVNISSPNTVGLRDWQAGEALKKLLSALMPSPKPLFVKVSPDLLPDQRAEVASVALEMNIAGLIVSNTTLSRPELLPEKFCAQTGGLSGPCLKPLAREALHDFYQRSNGRLVLISVGGIDGADEAFDRI